MGWYSIKLIETKRLNLSPLDKKDDQDLFALHSDPEVMKYIRSIDSDIFETKKKINSILNYTKANPSFGLWVARKKENNEFIGWGVLLHIEHNLSYPIEVGYRLHKTFWDKGYATEITNALLSYAKEVGVNEVCGITTEENKASQKVLEKSGLTYIEDRLYYETPVMYFEIKL